MLGIAVFSLPFRLPEEYLIDFDSMHQNMQGPGLEIELLQSLGSKALVADLEKWIPT